MKTVTCKITDAVNEFKAEWARGAALIYEVKVTGELKFSAFAPLANHNSWGYICNKEEFEARVFDMTVNYGESSSKHLEIWQEGIKRQPESDEQHAAQPVFTQAMVDNGELPQIGSKFYHQGKIVKTLSTSSEEGGVVTFLDGTDIGCCWNNSSWVMAIDTRTNKEKAVDEIMNDHEKKALSVRHLLSFAYDKWVGE